MSRTKETSINVVHNCFRRQNGLSYQFNYDHILGRLKVRREDSWRGIVPSSYVSVFNPDPPIFSAKFADCKQYGHILAIANEDGKIALQDTTTRNYDEERALAAPQCHYNAIFDLEWQPGRMRLVSASGDHTSRLWDMAGGDIRCVTTFLGHTRSVKTVTFRKEDNAVFATGGRDGAIIVWDTRLSQDLKTTSMTDNCIFSGHVSGVTTPTSNRRRPRAAKTPANMPSSSVTGLVFRDSNTLISCGATDGIIKIWDLRRNYSTYRKEPQPKYSLPYAGTSTFKGYTNLIADRNGTRLFANCMDNTIYCYNLSSYDTRPIAAYKGLQVGTFYIKSCLSPDEKYLASGSTNESAYIWNLQHPGEPLLRLHGHRVEVTCVAWGATHDYPLITCSDDARHLIWRIDTISTTENDQEEYSGYATYIKPLKQIYARTKTIDSQVNRCPTTPTAHAANVRKRRLSDDALPTIMEQTNVESETAEEQAVKRTRHNEIRGRILFRKSPDMMGTDEGDDQSALRLLCSNESLPKLKNPGDHCSSVVDNNTESSSTSEGHENLDNCDESLGTGNHSELTSHLTIGTDANILSTGGCHSSGIFSPTSNLPNFVMDGQAPHLAMRSPNKKRNSKIDWLTNIRKQRLLAASMSPSMSNIDVRATNFHAEASESSTSRGTKYLSAIRTQNIIADSKISNGNMLSLGSSSSPSSAVDRRKRNRNILESGCIQAETMINRSSCKRVRRDSETTLLRFFSVQKPNANTTEMKQTQSSTSPTSISTLESTTSTNSSFTEGTEIENDPDTTTQQ